jgi:hypothetical protein
LIILLPFPLEGKVFVSPPVAAVEEGESRWNSSLVGQFLDKALPFFLVKKYVQLMWKQYGDVEVFSVENGMFIFRFADVASCDEVFESKLWYVVNKPLIIRKWTPGMQVLKLTMSSIPIWVKFMHLPLEYWTKTCLSHVASGVGKPLYADRRWDMLGFLWRLMQIRFALRRFSLVGLMELILVLGWNTLGCHQSALDVVVLGMPLMFVRILRRRIRCGCQRKYFTIFSGRAD